MTQQLTAILSLVGCSLSTTLLLLLAVTVNKLIIKNQERCKDITRHYKNWIIATNILYLLLLCYIIYYGDRLTYTGCIFNFS